jgi:hypothetical protein
MIRFLLRFIGLWLLAGAFIFLVYDGTKSIAGKAIMLKSFEETWNDVSASSLAALPPLIERYAGAWLWDPVLRSILGAPTWLVLGVLGIAFMILGRKKKPLIGYARH